MNNKLVMDTLNTAIRKQKDRYGTILHFNQRFQYTSYKYKAICESNGIHISMSPKESPIDKNREERTKIVKKIGFIGMGNMAQAIASGWISQKLLTPDQIYA